MTKEDYDQIEDYDFNLKEDQLEIIRKLIVSRVKTEYDDYGRKRLKYVLELCINQNEREIEELFQMSSPCDDIVDKKGFINNIYKELFEPL
ncbi:hypothetical protein AB9M62_47830 [Bacillales bacterium AN1005]